MGRTELVIILSILGGLGLFAGILVVVRGVMARVRVAMESEVARRFSGTPIRRQALTANCFGVKSRGMAQVRGNGALVLTDDQLSFILAVPRRETTIPLADIVSVEPRRSHLGKSILRDLLFVEYRDGDALDSCAWYVPDLREWIIDIDSRRRLLPAHHRADA